MLIKKNTPVFAAIVLIISCILAVAPVLAPAVPSAMASQSPSINDFKLPGLDGSRNKSSVERSVNGFFSQIEEQILSAGELDYIYMSISTADKYAVRMEIIDAGGRLATVDVSYSPEDGSVNLPQPPDMALINARSALRKIDVEINSDTSAQVTSREAILYMLEIYKAIVARDIDISGIAATDASPSEREAIKIGLAKWYEFMPDNSDAMDAHISRAELAGYAFSLLHALERDYSQSIGIDITGDVAAGYIDMAFEISQLERSGKPSYSLKDLDSVSRLELAAALSAEYERAFGEINPAKFGMTLKFRDTDDAAAQKACAIGALDYVDLGDGRGVFFGWRSIRRENAISSALNLAQAMAWRVSGEEPGGEYISWGDVYKAAAIVAYQMQGRERGTLREVIVELNRDYDWYENQLDSGIYAINNCMPAVAAMAVNWYDNASQVTVRDMRALHPLGGAGWYPEQLYSVFDEYGLTYASAFASAEAMAAELDIGRLLIALYDEGYGGHSVVVKGYRKIGDAVWFILYDPDSPGNNMYGQPSGLDREVHSEDLLWAMHYFWGDYIAIEQP